MLGMLLNSFRGVHKQINKALQAIPMGQYHYGTNTTDSYTVTSSMDVTGTQLASRSSNRYLEYKNLTIEEGGKISADLYTENNPQLGMYAPLIIRCSDTLTINGVIHANGRGQGGSQVRNASINKEPISRNTGTNGFFGTTTANASTSADKYQAAFNFAANVPNMFNETLLVGSGGAYDVAPSYGVASGIASGGTNGTNSGGGAGGFIFIYYTHLYYNTGHSIIEYGQSADFPVWKICANGVGGNCGTNYTRGGGCIILAAKNIIIGQNGAIQSNGNLAANVERTGTNYSFFNNLPQLGLNQSGYYWDNTTKTYKYGTTTDRNYYFCSGKIFDYCDKSVNSSGSATLCGGGGMACGIRYVV